MRAAGTLTSATGYGRHDHLCLVFDDPSELVDEAETFLADGLALGAQVRYVVSGKRDAVGGDDVAGLRERTLDRLRPEREDAVVVDSLLESYGPAPVVVPEQQVREYVRATRAAVDAGFTGLRAAVDATALVATQRQLDSFARYEHLVDRAMLTHPFSALCAYDRTRLGADVVAQLACMHPVAHEESAPFRVHAGRSHAVSSRRGDRPGGSRRDVEVGAAVDAAVSAVFSLDGEIDLAAQELFPAALDRLDLVRGESIVVDASRLEYIDHRGMLALDALARRFDTHVILCDGRPVLARIARLLDLDRVTVWERRED